MDRLGSGIWTGINESDTLQYQSGRDADDEKHICPLQLGTIERCIKLYSNPGETVLTRLWASAARRTRR